MSALAGIALVVLLVWMFGSGLARFAGFLLALSGLIRVAGDNVTSAAVWSIVSGVGLWLVGHWLWAVKHKLWRTRLALSVFSLPALHFLAPIPTNHQPSRRPTWAESASRPHSADAAYPSGNSAY